nr:PREDICTED: uncharacterized protein LOC105679276 [Linepithema humile]
MEALNVQQMKVPARTTWNNLNAKAMLIISSGMEYEQLQTVALADVDEPVTKVDKLAKALGNLPVKYSGFITAWDSYDETKQTYENLVARLMKEEKRLTEAEEVAVAFASLNVNKTLKTNTDQKGKSTDKRNVECFFCKKKGHYKSECRKRLNKQQLQKEDKNRKHQALSVEHKNIMACDNEEGWLGDSAASKHMSY